MASGHITGTVVYFPTDGIGKVVISTRGGMKSFEGLLHPFVGKRVKITIEEIKEKEREPQTG